MESRVSDLSTGQFQYQENSDFQTTGMTPTEPFLDQDKTWYDPILEIFRSRADGVVCVFGKGETPEGPEKDPTSFVLLDGGQRLDMGVET